MEGLNIFSEPEEHVADREEQRRRDDLNWILSTRQGRRFVYTLMNTCRLFEPTMAQDSKLTAYLEGRRAVALDLRNAINTLQPSAFATMIRESQEDDDVRRASTESSH